MKLRYTLKFYSDWHCGSGLGAGADVDALVVKDGNGLPFVPGKTLKGLIREAYEDFLEFSGVQSNTVSELFGEEGGLAGILYFSNAQASDKTEIINAKAVEYLYRSVSFTSIDDSGIAKPHSLRKMQTVIPMELTGEIHNVPEDASDALSKCLGLIKRLGQNRTRGFGRCEFTSITKESEANTVSYPDNGALKFICTLLSDVILNVKSASAGANSTLDFIPGSNFLGIVAGELYNKLSSEESMLLFHSGKVRFSDAHPLVKGGRALRTPACMYYPKLRKEDGNELYISHKIINPESPELKSKQLKQCRNGFYSFIGKYGYPASITKSFAIKSARDKDNLRSLDSAMFGYESLSAGAQFCFEIEADKEAEALKEKICSAIVGLKHIGRSKTAQYGLVKIEAYEYTESASISKTGEVSVYADGRLIFYDEYGQPTYQPNAKDLGLDGEIDWSKSQIRTFQYAPWNNKRRCFDSDRCGIEKGSVIVVKNVKNCPDTSSYVGKYRNEGFGKVIYNPDFLESNNVGNALCRLEKAEESSTHISEHELQLNNSLGRYLNSRMQDKKSTSSVYEEVNKFVEKNKGLFTDNAGTFASQWGTIRAFAMSSSDDKQLKDKISDYISHGIKSEDWKRRSRGDVLNKFIKDIMTDTHKLQLKSVMVNLASEMAKNCKSNKNN